MIPASPKRLDDLGLPKVMMMDLLLKTMFRKSLDRLTDIAKTLCLSPVATQELIDISKGQRYLETTGMMSTSDDASNEVGYRLSDA